MHVRIVKGRVVKSPPKITITPSMVGKGKSDVRDLTLKIETPRKYVSFR
jgi:hypothetical protein